MKNRRRQSKKPSAPDSTIAHQIMMAGAALDFPELIKPAETNEEIRQKKLARAAGRRAVRQEFGEGSEIKLPNRLPLKRIQQESMKGRAKFEKELAEMLRQKQAAIERGLDIYSLDFIELITQAIEETHPLPATTGELVALLPQFDWRLSGTVPRTRDQRTRNRAAAGADEPCNSCWAFAATAAFESRLMYNVNKFNLLDNSTGIPVAQIALSVQGVLDCVTRGGCKGGSHTTAFHHFVKNGARLLNYSEQGVMFDDTRELLGKQGRCTEKEKKGIRALAWDFVFENDPLAVPKDHASICKMKEALLDHGPLVVLVTKGEGDAFDRYKEEDYPQGVYNLDPPMNVNHAVLLTGWDDARKAWIILNSFGSKWGGSCIDLSKLDALQEGLMLGIKSTLERERGCMYIAWGVSKIGKMAAWIEAPLLNEQWLKKARRQDARKRNGKPRVTNSRKPRPGPPAARKR